jgi:hypothetical protein
LENISLKEIECISEFFYGIEKAGIDEVDEKIFNKLEFIRDNYNKILLNIQKMISSSPIISDLRAKYEKNKSAPSNILKKEDRKNSVANAQTIAGNVNINTMLNPSSREWIDKLNNDIEILDKNQNSISNKIDKKNTVVSVLNNKPSNKSIYIGKYIFNSS